MSDNKTTTLYRYEVEYSSADGDETDVRLRTYQVVKETDYTYFIELPTYASFAGKLKRVLKNAYNTFAYDTKAKALEHFKRRTRRRIDWFEFWQKECEKALEIAKGITL